MPDSHDPRPISERRVQVANGARMLGTLDFSLNHRNEPTLKVRVDCVGCGQIHVHEWPIDQPYDQPLVCHAACRGNRHGEATYEIELDPAIQEANHGVIYRFRRRYKLWYRHRQHKDTCDV